MLNRFSVNAILKSIFGLMAAAVVILLAFNAWDSWARLKAANQMTNNSEAAIHLFAALHNMRSDRSNTNRELGGEGAAGPSQHLQRLRTAEHAGLQGALAALKLVEFPDSGTPIAEFEQNLNRLVTMQKETAAALSSPKAQRRAGLADEFVKHTNTFLNQLELLSVQMVQMVRLKDGYVDQLMHLKDLVWATRQNSGDAAVLVSNSLAGIVPPDAIAKYQVYLGQAKNTFILVQDFAAGLPLPASFMDAMKEAKNGLLSDEYTWRQMSILKAVIAGEKPGTDAATWSPISTGKQGVLQQAAEIALQTTKDYSADRYSRAQRNLLLQLGLLVLALVVSGMMVLMIARRITNPLLMLQKVMVQVAGGDFNVSVPKIDRRDELGQIVAAVDAMVEQVRATISSIKTSASEVTNASSEISSSTTDLSQRTEEQAASLEETTASMEVISATVKKNAENAQQANSSAGETRRIAEQGGAVVAHAVDAMAKIEDSSRKISDIIGVIDEIARQTNLLALNAAVEAARAGEAGRGFAVVASEVRSLAQRSSQAAKDIKDLITNSNAQVKDGVDLVNKAGASLNDIVESIKGVASIVADIAAASSEQAEGLEQINKALSQMDEATQQNSALVEENAATAKTLETQARAMDDKVSFFKVDEAGTSGAVAAAPRQAVQKPKAVPMRGRSKAA